MLCDSLSQQAVSTGWGTRAAKKYTLNEGCRGQFLTDSDVYFQH